MDIINAIFCIATIIDRADEMQEDQYMYFVDYEKTFNTVRHEDLVEILKETNVDGKDIRMMACLYWNGKAKVKFREMKPEWVDIMR